MREPLHMRPTNLYVAGNSGDNQIYQADKSDFETLETIKNSRMVPYFFPPDEASDQWYKDQAGNVKKLRTININGVSFQYEVGVPVMIPEFIYNHLCRCMQDAAKQTVTPYDQPGGNQCIGKIPRRKW